MNSNQLPIVETLNSFLIGELSACETYDIAIEKIHNANLKEQLQACKLNHDTRVKVLRHRIADLNAESVESSGLWGAFARLMEESATVLGDKAAISLLEEGEEHGLRNYEEKLDNLDPESRLLIKNSLLPAQEQTQIAMSYLKHAIE